MKLELKFFASIREALKVSEENLAVPDSIKTIAQLRIYLADRGGVWAEVLAESKVLRCALNHQMVDANTPLQEGAEIAFFPPVTGG
ncbi:molybdopterin converting factor subunit 1 [Polynucleobacter sp. AP-Latsch-80-C2]|jgi:molybdopterin synthase sulfur carrier subunit|uniref:molybdopterin converting factor subunit 1 n=1 Tax=Polynucleobacter sp. AP-Latsch-80-C2 TaxID=2576931 RepID=UPI001C0C7943|nr:molybdopterin converting factor subunit 1 [Polynucleobacter sp. AP-Latsch-80-C2]MBU3623096.1 molybdopterin converting factor subunit 1 [Polynucleobacter sp. AP-Latsch-80-C2]